MRGFLPQFPKTYYFLNVNLLIDGLLESLEFPWITVSIVALTLKFTKGFENHAFLLYLLYSRNPERKY